MCVRIPKVKRMLSRCRSNRRSGATPAQNVRRTQDGRPARLAGAAPGARAVWRSAHGYHQSDPRLPVGARDRGAARPAFPAGRVAGYPGDANRCALAPHVAHARRPVGRLAPAGCAHYTTRPADTEVVTQIGPMAFKSRVEAEDRIKQTKICEEGTVGSTSGTSSTTVIK